jgi:magnesium chelatase family protein
MEYLQQLPCVITKMLLSYAPITFTILLVKTFGSAVYGIEAITITIEVNISGGKPNYFIVGLPDNAVRESMSRMEAALQTNNLRMPRQRILVNMAPADIRKEGSAYDLTIATAILACSGQIKADEA